MTRRNEIEEKGLTSAFLVWVVNAAGLYLAATLIPGVAYHKFYSVPVAAALLWVASWLIEPILYLAALPITLATFGLFTVVVNGVVLILVAKVPHGFIFEGRFWGLFPAILTSLLISIFRLVLRSLLVRLRAVGRQRA